MNNVDVTIVVCTYNRAELLRGALESLVGLKTGGQFDYEVLVVDNASTDHTSLLIEEAVLRADLDIRGVRETRKGVACARNRGVAEARGRWIAYFDDDEIAEPDWLAELMSTAQSTGALVVGGAVHLLLNEEERGSLGPLCRRLLGETIVADVTRPYGRHVATGAGNVLIRRDVFEQIGGFDESLREAGEDSDLNRRIREANINAWYTPKAIVQHTVPAYRVTEDYFRWASLRNAGHIARGDREQWGVWLFPLVLVARLAQGGLLFVPRWARARLSGDKPATLDGKCLLWRIEGYLRWALRLMAPRLFAQQDFVGKLEFRAERHTLARKQPLTTSS